MSGSFALGTGGELEFQPLEAGGCCGQKVSCEEVRMESEAGIALH